jgi:hypothetical protein
LHSCPSRIPNEACAEPRWYRQRHFQFTFFSARHTIYDFRAAIREPLRAESQLAHSQTHSDLTFQSAKHKKVLNFLWLMSVTLLSNGVFALEYLSSILLSILLRVTLQDINVGNEPQRRINKALN